MSHFTYFKRVLGFDTGLAKRHEPNLRVHFYNFYPFVSAKVCRTVIHIVIVLVLSCLVCLLFSFVYASIFHECGIDTRTATLPKGASQIDYFISSVLIFEGFPLIEGYDLFSGLSHFVPYQLQAYWRLFYVVLFERLVGLVCNTIMMAIVVASATKPTNPIWIAPRVVLDNSQPGKERLTFKYWVRYPEGKFLYDCMCTVRFESDLASRSIDRSTEIDSRHVEEHHIRRGPSEINLGFDDLRESFPGRPEGPARKHALACMLLARYAEPGRKYKVSLGSYEEVIYLNEGLKKKYSNYHILFRVVGSTVDGKHVFNERKYSIDDVLIGYQFCTAEKVDSSRKDDKWPKLRRRAYRYRFEQLWEVSKVPRGGSDDNRGVERPTSFNMEGLDAEEHARDCLTDLGPVPDVLGDSQRPTSDTASIRLAKPSDKDAIFDLSKRVHDYDGKRYTDSEMNSLIIRCVCRNAIWTMPKDKSFALVAEADGKIVGFQLVMYPISESQNPGFDLGYSDADAELVLVIDAVVVHPDYRGQKLQSRMISMAEEIGIKRGKHIFIARVDIHNEYSLSNFIAEDYRRCRTYRDMRGVERELLVKRLRDTYKKESQHSN